MSAASDSQPLSASRVTPGWALFMVTQMALWASSYPAVGLVVAPGGLTGLELTAVRGIAAALLMSPAWVIAAARRDLPPPGDTARIMGWGAWYFCLALICFNTSIEWGRPELSGVLFAAFPIILAMLAAALGVERWDGRAVPYVLVALSGALLVVTRGDLRQMGVLTADLRATGLMLLTMVLIALYALGAKRLLQTYPPLLFTSLALAGGGIALLLVLLLLRDPVLLRLSGLNPLLMGCLVYLILVCTCLTEWMSMTGLRHLSVLMIGVFNYLQPPLIVLFSMILPESRAAFGWPMVIGGVLILCGASTVGTMSPDRPPWPEGLWRRLRPTAETGRSA